MIERTVEAIRAHALAEFPRECCGVVIIERGRERYIPCRNIAETPLEHFVIAARDFADAADIGEVVGIVHSHPNTSAQPSQADRVACEASQLEWFIINVHAEGTGEFVSFKPEGYEAGYVGRTYVASILDCYSLIRDYYAREFAIELRDYERRDRWWERRENLYEKNFKAEGFVKVIDAPQVGDIFLMQIRAQEPNHGAIYIGDGEILQHMYQRMSSRDMYDGYFQENTCATLRHRSKL